MRFQHLPVPFELYSDGIDLPVFEEFGAGTAALHLRDQLERNELLADTEYRREFRREFDRKKLGPTLWHRDFHDAVIVECPDETLIGKSFGQIADERGLHPLDAFLDVLVENGERNVRWTTTVANHRRRQLDKLAIEPTVHMGFSDAGAHLRNMAFYNYALRLLKRALVAERAGRPFMTVEHAVHRLTAEVADWFGLDAGTLRKGDAANFVVIDPAGLDDAVDGYHEARGAVLRRTEPHGQPQRRRRRRHGRQRRGGLPQRRVPRRLRRRPPSPVGSCARRARPVTAAPPCTPDVARTQQERREETVARLLDASIATIVDVGYARASAAVITQRAGLSGGALFRHFDTMGDFMAATAYEVMRRQLDAFGKQVAEIPPSQPALEGVLHTMRDVTGNDTNVVMYELLIAARTDEKLRATLQDVLAGVQRADLRHRSRAPHGRPVPRGRRSPRSWRCSPTPSTARPSCAHVLPQPEIEAGRIPLLLALLSPESRNR